MRIGTAHRGPNWTCPNCQTVNHGGNTCSHCGTIKPK